MDYIVNTPCGPVKGSSCSVPGVAAFKGIRYAMAGRWEYPRIVTGWNGIYDATAYGACSYQPRAFYDEEQNKKKYFYYNEFRKGETYTYSEDCLFLNIWTPENANAQSNLPVLLYIHGGGFTGGCGHEKHFDDPIWPPKGVIGVTINYRLGPLGFACLEEAAKEAGHTGNYGLYDQLAAIRWVRANIAAFGGDPQRITIMGQSAGAMSVQQHCLSPLTKGLFARAVMSSGGGVSAMMKPAKAEKMYGFWNDVMFRCGCTDLKAFREVPAEKLFQAWQEAKAENKKAMGGCSPVLDGQFIVGAGVDILKEGTHRAIPYMAGSTSHDMMPPIIFNMAKKWCTAQAAQGKHSSYAWFFDRMLPGDKNGAWHSSDLWYWFGTLRNCWRPMEERDQQLMEEMTTYLCNFVRNGDPNGGGVPMWEAANPIKKTVMRMGQKPARMARVSKLKLFFTMLTNKAVGE